MNVLDGNDALSLALALLFYFNMSSGGSSNSVYVAPTSTDNTADGVQRN